MFRNVLDRQAGSGNAQPSAAFHQQACGSLGLAHRLKLERKLDGHEGCVNTVAFTANGERLVSGSDDLYINVWNWQTGEDEAKPIEHLMSCCCVLSLAALADQPAC